MVRGSSPEETSGIRVPWPVLEDVLAVAKVGLFEWDVAADQVTIDESALRLMGRAPDLGADRLSGAEWLAQFHPDDRSPVAALFARENAVARASLHARVHHHGDDAWLWVRCAVTAEARPTEGSLIIRGALIDVGEEKAPGHRLGALFDGTGTGTWDWLVASNDLVTNRAYHTMLGEERPDTPIDGAYFFDRIHPGDAQRIQAEVERALVTEEPYDVELRLRCHDGDYRWTRSTGAVVERTPGGAPIRMVGYHVDVHDHVIRRQRLAALEQRLRLFVEHTPAAVAMFDREIRYMTVSRGWYEEYGLTERNIEGRSHYDVFPTLPERWKTLHQRAVAGESLSRDRDPFVREDGKTTWVRWALHPWRNEQGDIGGIIMFTEVITHQVEHEIALRNACQEAKAANRAKSAFLANMSHEIRTPMNGIIGMTDLLLDTELTEPQRQLGHVVRRSANALLTIINDILDFSKVEAGKLELEEHPLSIPRLVSDVVGLLQHKAEERGLQLTSMVGAEMPTVLLGDEGRLRQILVNLLGNAIKFTETGSVNVACRYDKPTSVLEVEVRDTGIGIPAEKLASLFESFSQVDASITRRFGGTGLGLAISRRLARLMKGDITVDSVVGEGSRFTVRVPLAAAPDRCRSPASPDHRFVPELPRLRVLLADDNAVNRQVGIGLLRRLGHDVETANDGTEVLSRLKRGGNYDVILMDVQMPELDGISATRAIRQSSGLMSSIPIIALTAHALKSDEQACLEAGMNGYLTKPVRSADLQAILHRLLTHLHEAATRELAQG